MNRKNSFSNKRQKYSKKRKKEKTFISFSGCFKSSQSGYGFVVPESDIFGEDIFIPAQNTLQALDGDQVSGKIIKRKPQMISQKKSFEGKITTITARGTKEVVGTIIKDHGTYYALPEHNKFNFKILIKETKQEKLKANQKVLIKLTKYPHQYNTAQGEIIKVLGEANDPQIDTKVVMEKYKLPDQFPPQVLKEAEKIALKIPHKELQKRKDFRSEFTITIDPEDAKDFDDAITLKKRKNGSFMLGVHIADVAHYISAGSHLDNEALKRGTSVYFPDKVIPMLPEKISNGICSLKEGVNRLTKSIMIDLSPQGEIIDYAIYRGVIKSDKRLTYKEVLDFLEEKSPILNNPKLKKILKEMEELAGIIKENRIKKGCLYLDLPEIRIKLDKKGIPLSLEKESSDKAHSIIEEFMLTANETVASHIKKSRLPAVYRVHEVPDDEAIEEFKETIKSFNLKIPVTNDTKSLQKLLKKIDKKPEAYIINLALLKSLKQASYSAKNIGHFALASKTYTHFTSPIRRFADLIIHRILDYLIDKKPLPPDYQTEKKMSELAYHISSKEKIAKEAEYSINDLKKIRFLEKEENKEKIFKGLIVSVHSFGFFVQIPEYLIDGLVPIKNLLDDYFIFYKKEKKLSGKKSKKSFTIGDTVTIKIAKLDSAKERIDFLLVE